MADNLGKKFENIVREAFSKVPNTAVIRLHDQMSGFAGSKNPCDLLVYHYPNMYCIECKSVHGNTLPFTNITDYQWKSLLELSNTHGIYAGIICWWIDKDVTMFLPIKALKNFRDLGMKSVRWDDPDPRFVKLTGKKKRVFFEYDMKEFI